MEKFNNGEYLAPQVEVVEVAAQSLICQSGNLEDRDYVDPWTN